MTSNPPGRYRFTPSGSASPSGRRISAAAGMLIVLLVAAFAPPALAQCDGLTNSRAYFEPGERPLDVVGVRYKFRVAANEQAGLQLKILFAAMRFYTPGQVETYLLESNLYSRGLLYDDPVCTTWPLQGTYVGSESSLRVAVPDYIGLAKTGAKTFSPLQFPRQSYLIDGSTVPKTDMISQLNLNGITGEVKVERGGLITDKSGWRCEGDLDSSDHRRWNAQVMIGPASHDLSFALPDSNARYFAPWEILNFYTEFFGESGLFKVYLWDLEILREGGGGWRPLVEWIVDRHCGSLTEYGVRLATFQGRQAIEISNDGPASFFPAGTIFSLAAEPEPVPTLSGRGRIALAAVLLGISVWLLASGARASPGRR